MVQISLMINLMKFQKDINLFLHFILLNIENHLQKELMFKIMVYSFILIKEYQF